MEAPVTVRQLGQALVDRSVLTPEEFEAALLAAQTAGVPAAVHLIESGRVSRPEALAAVASRLGIEFVDLDDAVPEQMALQRLSRESARAEMALPLRIEDGSLVIATDDPLDLGRRERLTRAARSDVTLVLTSRSTLVRAIEAAYEPGRQPIIAPAPPGPAPESATRVESGYHVNDLLAELIDRGGSDLHLAAGSPPQIRINGDLQPIGDYERLLPAQIRSLTYAILSGKQREEFEENLELDFSHPVPGKGRFRINLFHQRGSVGAVMRAIPSSIPTIEDLGLPPVVRDLAEMRRGLVLVTGITGSGKSTTLAAMIDAINSSRSVHIMTVEDPIEFMHHHKMSLVNQRELGGDTRTFAEALRRALRQDPDVILVGEMRDLETMATALTAAETGHLVLATLHTKDAPGSVERIVDVFPPHQQQQIRVQLAESLQGVISQQLLPTADAKGRVAAVEILVGIPAVRNLIREGKGHQLRSVMQTGGKHGMQTMDADLVRLVRSGKVDPTVATNRAYNPDEFTNLLGGKTR